MFKQKENHHLFYNIQEPDNRYKSSDNEKDSVVVEHTSWINLTGLMMKKRRHKRRHTE